MRTFMKGEIAFIILLQLFAASTVVVDAKYCTRKCGNMTIAYPFGIEKGCFLDGFNITCNKTTGQAYIWNVEIIDISLAQAEMRVYNKISFACYYKNGDFNGNGSYSPCLNTANSPYRFSSTRNKFTAIGCRTLAYIFDPYSFDSPYVGGCLSSCQGKNYVTENATCSGIGCCQTVIPKGLAYYNVTFDSAYNHSYVWSFSPCSYAFLVEDDWYKFNSSDVYKFEIYYRNKAKVPMVLDWAIRTETCEEAKLNKMGTYSCVSSNSDCKDSKNGLGYTCYCQKGYEGNPYIDQGCKDVDECKNKTLSSLCYGNCSNIPGGYLCSCPQGTSGNATIEGNCRQTSSPTKYIIPIAGLSSFLVIAILHLIHRKAKLVKAKEKCFRQNGGLLLQAQINAHQSVRFRIFSIKEITAATNNFDETLIKGRGGQGIVYEGTIDDKLVAIKKSIMIDEKKIKEFVNEMYILSLINHKNVIQILGCCLEVEVPVLVYEFIPRGTLYQRIQQKNQRMPLGFRIKIAIESASALTYLHYDSSPSIIHGDIKSSNILLDEYNVAKISDFGASVLPLKDINETGVPGTYGYLDPESIITGQLTDKSDVYSFAVVILELLTRMKAVYFDELGEKRNLAETFKKEGLDGILDDEIRYVITKEQIVEFSQLLTVCLKTHGSERPTMKRVLAWLGRMQEFYPNFLDDSKYENSGLLHAESSNHNTYTAQYYSSGHRTVFELDYLLTR